MLSLSRVRGRVLTISKRLWGKLLISLYEFNYIFFRVKDIGKIWGLNLEIQVGNYWALSLSHIVFTVLQGIDLP